MSDKLTNQSETGFLLTRDQYDKHGNCVFEFWLKTDSGIKKLLVESETPTCFSLASNQENIEQIIKSHRLNVSAKSIALTTFSRQPTIAIYSQSLKEHQKLRRLCQEANITLLEDDIKPVDRYLMERFIQGSLIYAGNETTDSNFSTVTKTKIKKAEYETRFSTLSIDIECDELGNLYSIGLYSDNLFNNEPYQSVLYHFVDAQHEPNEIPSWLIPCHSEQMLLQQFVLMVRKLDPDFLIGWNFIKFDIRVLLQASERTGVKLNLGRDGSPIRFNDGTRNGENRYPDKCYIAGRVVLDGIEVMKNATYSFASFSLNNVSKEILEDTKLIQEDSSKDKLAEIKHLYRFEPIALAEYNLQDCILVSRIFTKERLIEFLQTRTKLTGLELDRIGGSVAAFTNLYLPHVHRKGWIAPNLVAAKDYVHSPGGFVMDSVPGIHKDVLVFDFKSLYPSIIRTFNVDPISLLEAELIPENDTIAGFRGGRFSRQKSTLSDMLDSLWQAREQAKKQKNKVWSNAIKIIMNSFYGVLGSAGCRFYDTKLASSITMRGHWVLNQSKIWFEQHGYQVIYGDTDSIFVSLDGNNNTASKAKELEQKLNDWWQDKIKKEFNINSKMEMEFETHFSPFFMPTIRGAESGSKKRYAGLKVLGDGKSELVFKGLESVRSDWTDLAKKFQTRLFELVFSGQECETYIESTLLELNAGKLDTQLIYRKRIKQSLESYVKTTPPHIKAARKANNEQNSVIFGRGTQIEYVISTQGPVVVTMKEYTLDYQHYIDKQLMPIAESILSIYSPAALRVFSKQLSLI